MEVSAGTERFPVRLQSVPVANKQEPRGGRRGGQRSPPPDFVVIQVAAVRTRNAGTGRRFSLSGYPNAAEHGRCRVLKFHMRTRRLAQSKYAAGHVDIPRHQIIPALADQVLLVPIGIRTLDLLRRQRSQQLSIPGPAELAVHSQAPDVNCQSVSGLRSFDIKRACLGIGRLRNPNAAFVLAPGINRLRSDDLSGPDACEWRVSVGKSVIVRFRDNLPALKGQSRGQEKKGTHEIAFMVLSHGAECEPERASHCPRHDLEKYTPSFNCGQGDQRRKAQWLYIPGTV